jgi:predicted DNA-binding protein
MATVKTSVTPHIKNEISTKANKAGITDAEYVRQAIEEKLRGPNKK